MMVQQIVGLVILAGIVAFYIKRSLAKKTVLRASAQPGVDMLRAGFMQTRTAGESEPVCVVAYHHSMMSVDQITVGVTEHRVLVVKGTGPLHAFPYDDDGEHLASAQKKQHRRGFFDWSHGTFGDGTTGYSPKVKNFPPFAGQEWRMYPTAVGFSQQRANLREFANRFYFQWFYD